MDEQQLRRKILLEVLSAKGIFVPNGLRSQPKSILPESAEQQCWMPRFKDGCQQRHPLIGSTKRLVLLFQENNERNSKAESLGEAFKEAHNPRRGNICVRQAAAEEFCEKSRTQDTRRSSEQFKRSLRRRQKLLFPNHCSIGVLFRVTFFGRKVGLLVR